MFGVVGEIGVVDEGEARCVLSSRYAVVEVEIGEAAVKWVGGERRKWLRVEKGA